MVRVPFPAVIRAELLSPVGMRHDERDRNEQKLPDQPADRVGHEIVKVIQSAAKNQLQVFGRQGDEETGDDGTDPDLAPKPRKDVRQQISHRDKEHDIQIHLDQILGLQQADVRNPLRKTVAEDRPYDFKESGVRFKRKQKILVQRDVNAVRVAFGTGEKHDKRKGDSVDRKHAVQNQTAKLQKRVGFLIDAEPVLQIQTELFADRPVDDRKQHNKDRNQHGQGNGGECVVDNCAHTAIIKDVSGNFNRLFGFFSERIPFLSRQARRAGSFFFGNG